MKTKRYVDWKDEDMWLGYLEEFPDYMTQGESLDELKENLKDIYKEICVFYDFGYKPSLFGN